MTSGGGGENVTGLPPRHEKAQGSRSNAAREGNHLWPCDTEGSLSKHASAAGERGARRTIRAPLIWSSQTNSAWAGLRQQIASSLPCAGVTDDVRAADRTRRSDYALSRRKSRTCVVSPSQPRLISGKHSLKSAIKCVTAPLGPAHGTNKLARLCSRPRPPAGRHLGVTAGTRRVAPVSTNGRLSWGSPNGCDHAGLALLTTSASGARNGESHNVYAACKL